MYGTMTMDSSVQFYFGSHHPPLQQTNRLFNIGNYQGNHGVRLYLSVTNNSNKHGSRGFFDIVGKASGETEIILDMFDGWDGTRIDLVRAYDNGSTIEAFIMQPNIYNGRIAELRSRIEGSDRIWFIAEYEEPEKKECLKNLILQKKNKTLVVDNNPTSNGGYDFVYYRWFRNDEMIHQGAWGAGLGGLYNTGRSVDLNPYDTYYVVLLDSEGNEHTTCPYNPVVFTPQTTVTAYPNPARTHQSTVAVEVETQDEDLLANGIIFVYDLLGHQLGQTRTNGHRITSVQLPSVAATYILRFVSDNVQEVTRVMVSD
jgi:hypothetical protein